MEAGTRQRTCLPAECVPAALVLAAFVPENERALAVRAAVDRPEMKLRILSVLIKLLLIMTVLLSLKNASSNPGG